MTEKTNSGFQYIALAMLGFIIINLFYPIPKLEFINDSLRNGSDRDKAVISLLISFLLAMCFTGILVQLVSFGIGITVFSFYDWLPQPLLIIIAFIIELVVYKIVRS